jgi:hypothetical protein
MLDKEINPSIERLCANSAQFVPRLWIQRHNEFLTRQIKSLLTVCVDDSTFAGRVYDALIECSSFVNSRRIERDAPAVLRLSFYA